MNTILENPLGIGIFGLAISGLIAFTAVRLGNWKAVYAAIGMALLTVAAVVTSIILETDRERVIRSIHEVAAALRENDHATALTYMHPNATTAIQRARQEISRFNFREAKVTSIRDVSVNDKTQPPTAVSEFIATMKVEGDHTLYGATFNGARLLKVYWMKQGDRWLIRDYEHSDVRAALMN